jgi:hypothetical protein
MKPLKKEEMQGIWSFIPVFVFLFLIHILNNLSRVSFFMCPVSETCRPVFRYFTLLGPRNFCAPPPPPLFVRIHGLRWQPISNSLSSF